MAMLDIDILGSLVPDPITMLAQLMATGVLLLIFKKYLWEPVSNFLEKRAEIAQEALTEADLAKVEALSMKDQAHQQLQDAASTAQQIIDRSENEAKKIRESLLEQAQSRVEQKIEQADQQIELQRKEMKLGIHKEIVDVAMLASERLMRTKIDESFDRQAIEAFIKDVDDQ
jgi:F-type H+-transporting ATPase subunit b